MYLLSLLSSGAGVIAQFMTKRRSMDEWYTRMAVENGLSFNQMATSEFIWLAFTNLAMKPKKSRSGISDAVNSFIVKLQEETKEQMKKDFKGGERFSIVTDEWTSIRN